MMVVTGFPLVRSGITFAAQSITAGPAAADAPEAVFVGEAAIAVVVVC